MPENIAVWIDHREARVMHVREHDLDESTVMVPQHVHRRHPKGVSGAKEHPDDATHFFRKVTRTLVGSERILILGPSTAKLELIRYLHRHALAVEARVVGVETVDHPTDKQIAAYTKLYFHVPGPGAEGHQAPGAAPPR